MWQAASISRKVVQNVATRSHFNLQHPSSHLLLLSTHQKRLSSSSSQKLDQELNSEENSALREVFESIERQTLEADRLRALQIPTPWFNLLHYPSRAAWRSTDHLFNSVEKRRDDEYGEDTTTMSMSPLSQTQFNLIQHSGRTNKQLRRTYKRIMETHHALAIKRERERRMAANLSRSTGTKHSLTGEGGDLEDVKGRHVGSWNERSRSSTLVTCDDPSVSLLLSYGTSKFNREFTSTGSTVEKKQPVEEVNAMYSMKRKSKLISSASVAPAGAAEDKPVGYGPEQTMTNLKFRFGPNYSIVKRVLKEVQSLLGGVPQPDDSSTTNNSCFQPKRVLDFGSGVGSSSAAALDVFGIPRDKAVHRNGIEWIHSIDASQSMRDATECVLKSVLHDVPWGHDIEKRGVHENEEIEDYEKIVREIKGDVSERSIERQRKRMLKWEQSWELKNDYFTRLTFGESIVDASSFYSQLSLESREEKQQRPNLPWQKQLNEQRQRAQETKEQATSSQKGSFDLILCTYTLAELNSVSSTLTAAALLWEKLAPGGVMVFVEPGTPDGFSTLRSVRSMLLECFPPREIRDLRAADEKRLLVERLGAEEDEEEKEALRKELDELESTQDDWDEECQVIAPCTHNGLCPMSRHQKNHIKRNTRFGKYEIVSDSDNTDDQLDNFSIKETGNDNNLVQISEGADQESEEEEEERLIQELIDQGMDRAELEAMMCLMDSFGGNDDEDASDDSDNEFDLEEYDGEDEDGFYEMGNNKNANSKSTLAQTDVFGSSFCSFVHNFPGGSSRRKGEKFTYLVVQKRTPSTDSNETELSKSEDLLNDVDIVDLLSKSVHHVNGLKSELIRMSRRGRSAKNDKLCEDQYNNSHHVEQLRTILDEAVQIEETFLDSTKDKLGMELLHGDDRRRGWGRLVRAPIKKKGHILVDYCSVGCTGKGRCTQNLEGIQGRIVRQKVSRSWSARVAPGCYAAARKSRWGGLWPDLSERVP